MLEIVLEQARHRIGNLLGYDNPAKSAAFFYGGAAGRSLDEAARASTAGKRPLNIPEEALWKFWEFAQYPAGYEDPLQPRLEWDVDHMSSAVMWPSLYVYLRHRRDWISANGELVRRRQG